MYRNNRCDYLSNILPYRLAARASTESTNSSGISRSNGKFWIYFTIILVYLLLIGIIVLVLLVLPKAPMDWNKVVKFQNHTKNYKTKPPLSTPTRSPTMSSAVDPDQPVYPIDPRSDLSEIEENTPRHNNKFPSWF